MKELPKEVNIGHVLDDEELDSLFMKIADYLSDEYGYCVNDFCIEIKATDINWDRSE